MGVAEFCLYEEKSGKNWGGCPKIWRKNPKKGEKPGCWVSFWTDLGKYIIRVRQSGIHVYSFELVRSKQGISCATPAWRTQKNCAGVSRRSVKNGILAHTGLLFLTRRRTCEMDFHSILKTRVLHVSKIKAWIKLDYFSIAPLL